MAFSQGDAIGSINRLDPQVDAALSLLAGIVAQAVDDVRTGVKRIRLCLKRGRPVHYGGCGGGAGVDSHEVVEAGRFIFEDVGAFARSRRLLLGLLGGDEQYLWRKLLEELEPEIRHVVDEQLLETVRWRLGRRPDRPDGSEAARYERLAATRAAFSAAAAEVPRPKKKKASRRTRTIPYTARWELVERLRAERAALLDGTLPAEMVPAAEERYRVYCSKERALYQQYKQRVAAAAPPERPVEAPPEPVERQPPRKATLTPREARRLYRRALAARQAARAVEGAAARAAAAEAAEAAAVVERQRRDQERVRERRRWYYERDKARNLEELRRRDRERKRLDRQLRAEIRRAERMAA